MWIKANGTLQFIGKTVSAWLESELGRQLSVTAYAKQQAVSGWGGAACQEQVPSDVVLRFATWSEGCGHNQHLSFRWRPLQLVAAGRPRAHRIPPRSPEGIAT
eukprot:3440979-Prymnesium_polylepis.1